MRGILGIYKVAWTIGPKVPSSKVLPMWMLFLCRVKNGLSSTTFCWTAVSFTDGGVAILWTRCLNGWIHSCTTWHQCSANRDYLLYIQCNHFSCDYLGLCGCWWQKLCLGQRKHEAVASNTTRIPNATPTATYNINVESSARITFEIKCCCSMSVVFRKRNNSSSSTGRHLLEI